MKSARPQRRLEIHPLGRRLVGLSAVVVLLFVSHSAIQRYVLQGLSLNGQAYAEIREHAEARQEVTELAGDIQAAQAQLGALLVARSADHARQILKSYAERLAAVDARFDVALGSEGLESARPILQWAHEGWQAHERVARERFLGAGPLPTREEIAAFFDGKEARRYHRVLQQLEAAGNACRLEEEAHRQECTREAERAMWGLDGINAGLVLILIVYLRRTTGSMVQGLAREAAQAHLDALRADIVGALTGEAHLAEALQRCAEAVPRHMDARLVRIWLVSPGVPRLELKGGAEGGAPEGRGAAPIPTELGALERVLKEDEPLAEVSGAPLAEWARREAIADYRALPLRVGTRAVGVLELYLTEPLAPRAAGPIREMADALALGIERWWSEQARESYAAELERSNGELERFAYVASHDLQEPLRMVGSFTQLLARRYKGKLDATADEYIQFTVDGVARMQRLLKDLLTYSRAGTRQKELVPTDCRPIVEAALANLQAAVAESGAKVSVGPLPSVMGDEVQLGQLFQNLIGNAIKFRGEKPPAVRVSAAPGEDGQWVISVKDDGIGIAPEHFQRLFVIFQRLHSEREYPGTGIGLAICKKIVERHGGRIWVESTPGQGATFSFTLRGAAAVEAPLRASA